MQKRQQAGTCKAVEYDKGRRAKSSKDAKEGANRTGK